LSTRDYYQHAVYPNQLKGRNTVDDDFWQGLPYKFEAETFRSLNPDLSAILCTLQKMRLSPTPNTSGLRDAVRRL